MVALVEMRNGAVSVSQVRDAWRKYPHVRRIAAAISQSQRVVPAERSRPCHILESEQPVSQLTYRAGKPPVSYTHLDVYKGQKYNDSWVDAFYACSSMSDC